LIRESLHFNGYLKIAQAQAWAILAPKLKSKVKEEPG
jgi:hypothetical protein